MIEQFSAIDLQQCVYFNDAVNRLNVIGFNDDFIIINDTYPNTIVHLLVLPRGL